ncbi:uncharacterized protein LOC122262224 [Penaeus japonicus]|uniref:uncharacterized protein LOC122262224 n=1 Tax=Penaeus japonicus TaxID=27405 RepID=UPI001C7124AF|nr:uncharacterized protein LOC122262224 [Penaeus japonicus]
MEASSSYVTAIMFTQILLFWTVLASAQPPFFQPRFSLLNPQYRNVARYPFARIAGVFRVVDEDSCRCVPRSRRCAIDIMEESVTKARWLPCPFLTKYCCQREAVFDRSDAEEKKYQNRNSTAGDVPTTIPSHLIASNARIYSENSHSNRIQIVTQSPEAPSLNIPDASDAPNVPEVFNVSSDLTVPDASNFSSVLNISEASDSSSSGITSSFIPVKKPARAKPSACLCSTRDQCLSWWTELNEPPEVKVRTSLRCEVPGQVTCCFGRIIPPRHYRSHEPTPSEDTARHPFTPTRRRPFATPWGSGVSWF